MCPRTDTHFNYMTGVALTADFFACYCRCAMSGADRVIRRSTAGAVLGVAATLAVNVAHDLGHGLIGDGAPRFPAT